MTRRTVCVFSYCEPHVPRTDRLPDLQGRAVFKSNSSPISTPVDVCPTHRQLPKQAARAGAP